MSRRRKFQDSQPFSVWAGEDTRDEKSVYEYEGTLDTTKSTINFKISDFHKIPYFHVTKVKKRGGKTSKLSLDLFEFYDVFENAEFLTEKMEDCSDKI